MYGDSLFIIFIDLKKAYDSVPTSALWNVLLKCWVPPTVLSYIQSFSEVVEASVRAGDTVADRFEFRNSLWQGCTMVPTLFNLYFNAILSVWCDQCGESGLPALYKHGRKVQVAEGNRFLMMA